MWPLEWAGGRGGVEADRGRLRTELLERCLSYALYPLPGLLQDLENEDVLQQPTTGNSYKKV